MFWVSVTLFKKIVALLSINSFLNLSNTNRIPTLHGRRAEGLFGDQMHSSVQSDAWRNPEYVNKVESNTHWNKDSYQGEQHVDHWAKFIDAIEHAQKRGPSPMTRYHIQGDEERQAHSPRRLPRERLPSPDNTRFGVEEQYRMPSPSWNRNQGVEKELSSQHNHRESRDRSYPRYQEGRRHTDYGYHNEEHGDQYHERGSFPDRYKNTILSPLHTSDVDREEWRTEERIQSLSISFSDG